MLQRKFYLMTWFLAFNCVNGLAPDYLIKYFVKRSAVHNRNTRECNSFVVPRYRLSTDKGDFTTGASGNGMG